MTFEQAMARLDEIVEQLAAGNIPLDEMVKLYEEGDRLSKHCLGLLDGYEARLGTLDAGEA